MGLKPIRRGFLLDMAERASETMIDMVQLFVSLRFGVGHET